MKLAVAVQTAATFTGRRRSLAAVSRLVECLKKRNNKNSKDWEEFGSYDTIYSELSVAGWWQRHTREKVGSCSVLCLPTLGNT